MLPTPHLAYLQYLENYLNRQCYFLMITPFSERQWETIQMNMNLLCRVLCLVQLLAIQPQGVPKRTGTSCLPAHKHGVAQSCLQVYKLVERTIKTDLSLCIESLFSVAHV